MLFKGFLSSEMTQSQNFLYPRFRKTLVIVKPGGYKYKPSFDKHFTYYSNLRFNLANLP